MKRENYSFEQGKAPITCINSQLSYLIQQRTTRTPRVLGSLFLWVPLVVSVAAVAPGRPIFESKCVSVRTGGRPLG